MTHPDAIVASWGHDWREALPVRSPAEQSALLAETQRAVARLQAAAHGTSPPGHALHRKALVETSSATLDVSDAIPEPLQIGPFLPNATWPVAVRLSSAFPVARSDTVPDQRGLGVHLVDHERTLDLLATTGEAHHARDARAMIASLDAAANAAGGGTLGKLGAVMSLVRTLGVSDALRLSRTVTGAAEAGVSLAASTFFSRAPFQLGPFAVRYRFAPLESSTGNGNGLVAGTGPNALADDFRARLANGPVRWSFDLQGYLDREQTPMDDHRVPWRSAWLSVASLTISAVTALGASLALRAAGSWPASNGPVLDPLGDLNLLRGVAYETSQHGR